MSDDNEDITGADAIQAVSADRDPAISTQASALAYFMGEVPPPGRDTRLQREVDFGEVGQPNFQLCTFRILSNEELVKCEQEASVKDAAGVLQRIDPFIRWSFVFAYACQDPSLGQALTARRQQLQATLQATPGDQEAEALLLRLTDSSALVREVFRFQPGVLQAVANEIEDRSRLGEDRQKSIREVEAGKGLS